MQQANSPEMAAIRLKLWRKAKKLEQKAAHKARVVKEDNSHRKLGCLFMVRINTSLAPINHRGQTIHLIPNGLITPAVRTKSGVRLLLTGGRTYNCLNAHREYDEIKAAVPLSILTHPGTGLPQTNLTKLIKKDWSTVGPKSTASVR